jgi:hypothetical protein
MAYVGTPIDTTNQFQSLQGKRFSGDASTTAFTLDIAPSSVFDIEVFVENVRQDPNSAYSLNGTTLTFTGAPPSGTNNIYVVHQAKAVGTINPPTGSVTNDTLASGSFSNITGTGTLTSFTSTGIDDNASSTALTIASDGRNTVDSTNEKALIIHHSDGSTVNMGFQNNAGNASFIGFSSSDFTVAPAGTERTRITSSGELQVGSIASNGTGHGVEIADINSQRGQILIETTLTSAVGMIYFVNGNGSVGSIVTDGSSTAYNTSSDHRLKENVVDMTGATERLKQLSPKRFNFITNADTTVDGFLAHEVSSIVPEAITGIHNEVQVWEEGEELPEGVSVGDNKLDDEGNTIPKYQGIDQSKLVPLLVKTIQELEARITALEG